MNASRLARHIPGSAIRGATLVESMMVLALLAILLGTVGLTSMARMVQIFQLRSAVSDLMADLQLARATAIQRNVRVVMCKGSPPCATSGGWEQGWALFEDSNGNGVPDNGEEILWQRERFDAGLRIRGNSTVADYIAYASLGTSKLHNGGFQAGTVTFCARSDGPVEGRQVVINAVGRVRTQVTQLPSCM